MSFAQDAMGFAPMVAYTPGILIVVGIVLVFVIAIVAAFYLFFKKDE